MKVCYDPWFVPSTGSKTQRPITNQPSRKPYFGVQERCRPSSDKTFGVGEDAVGERHSVPGRDQESVTPSDLPSWGRERRDGWKT